MSSHCRQFVVKSCSALKMRPSSSIRHSPACMWHSSCNPAISNSLSSRFLASLNPSVKNKMESFGSSFTLRRSYVTPGKSPGGIPATCNTCESVPRNNSGPGIPALTMLISAVARSKVTYWIAVCLPGIPRCSNHSTLLGCWPVLWIPRSVPTTSAAYIAAGRPFPETSSMYMPIVPSESGK